MVKKGRLLALCGAITSHSLLDVLTSRLAPGAELFWPFSSRRYAAGLVDYLDFSIRVRGPLEFVVLILRVSLIEAMIFVPLFLAIRLIVNRVRAGSAVKLES